MNLIANTTTETGLTVQAALDTKRVRDRDRDQRRATRQGQTDTRKVPRRVELHHPSPHIIAQLIFSQNLIGAPATAAQIGEARLTAVTNWARSHGKQIFIGELALCQTAIDGS